MGGFPPGFSGIDPTLMEGMIKEFRRGRADLAGTVGAYRTKLAAFGVDTTALAEIDRVCSWIDDQIPMLTKRRDLATALADTSQPGLAMVDESFVLSPAEARRQGAALAARFRSVKDARPGDGAYHDLLNELGAHRFDSDYSASFFAGLGAQSTRRLPEMINLYGGKGPSAGRSGRPARLSAVRCRAAWTCPDSATSPGPCSMGPCPGRTGKAWRRSCVSGDSREWLARLARLHALDPMYRQATSGEGASRTAIDVQDHDTFQLFLRSLGDNPAASRLAFQGLAEDKTGRVPRPPFVGPSEPDLARVLSAFTRLAQTDGKIAEQLGCAYAGAAGAYDEADG